MKRSFTRSKPLGRFSNFISGILLASLALTSLNTAAQVGYIQLKTRAISEDIAPEFTYDISGGPTSVSSKVLSDRTDAFRRIYHIAGESAGGLFVIATSGTTAGTPNPGNIFYRPSGSAEWQNTGFAAFRIDGAANGGFIAVVRTASSPAGAGSQVWYRSDAAATPVNVTGALTGKSITQVSHNYDNRMYAVTTESGSNLYSRPADLSSDWVAAVNPQNVVKVDAIPNTDNIFHTRVVSGSIRLYSGAYNSNGTLWDDDMGSNSTSNRDGHYFAATKSAGGIAHVVYYLPEYVGVYYKKNSVSGSWQQDASVAAMQMLTATGDNGQMVYGVLTNGQASLPNRIFARAGQGEFNGFWMDDERVQTTVKGNTVIFPVAAGSYNITQSASPGWHGTNIELWDPSNNSTANTGSGSVIANVSAGEVVTIEFENQLTSAYDMSNAPVCDPAFTEDFSSYVNGTYGDPLAGLTSYHKATAFFGFGYYAVMSNLSGLGAYAYTMSDHTNDAQRGMFVVDASFEKGTFFRKRFTGLQAGVPYNFTAFIANINGQGPGYTRPDVSFEIYNTNTGALIATVNSGDIAADSIWHGVSIAFTSPVSNVELVLRNNALGTIGNDLALDDISFSLAIPKPEATTAFDCATAGTVTVRAPVAAAGSPIGYEYSLDGISWQSGTTFTNVAAGVYPLFVRYETATGCVAQGNISVVDDCVATPVILLSFNAEKNNAEAHLNWSTAKEENNKGFELQRSSNGSDWVKIGFMNSLATDGNSKSILTYKFVDVVPGPGLNLYRLKQEDNDGSYNYSAVSTVNFSAGDAITIYPNPFTSFIKIKGLSGNSTISVFNGSGQELKCLRTDGTSELKMDLSDLPAGVYDIIISEKDGHRTSKRSFKL